MVMNIVGDFFKVSLQEFSKAHEGKSKKEIKAIYDKIKIPARGTVDSAGYDFFTPVDIHLKPGETVTVATGIRISLHTGWFLGVYPRSGMGFKFRAQLDNTVGIIDGDYYYSDNEGHIFVKMTNDGREGKDIVVPSGQGFCQGVIQPYGITRSDNATAVRNGGFGSTDKK